MKNKKVLFCFAALFVLVTSASAQNYDEAKVPQYKLPDALTTNAGKKVTNKKIWEKTRRAELLKLFEDTEYGQMPHQFDSIRFQVTHQDDKAMAGRAKLKEVDVKVYRNKEEVVIHLVMFLPTAAKKPVPLFLFINNRPKTNMDPSRVQKTGFWPAEQVIDSGYAVAAFHNADAAPDDTADYRKGMLRLYPEQLTAPNGLKAIGAWAWATSRVMDYLQTDKEINGKKVALAGHSRGGKTSLWVMAQDPRFAMCLSNCSGNSGAAISRRRYGETIKSINTEFPHWFTNNYRKYNDREDDLPIDQHELIALSAPRPVYTTNTTQDQWADPKGSFMAIKAIESVYALYGYKSNLPAALPAPNVSFTQPPLGYHYRVGKHDLTPYDWDRFIHFASLYYKKH